MSNVRYERDSARTIRELEFPCATVLDTAALRRRWAPWFDLSPAPDTPRRAQHAAQLASMLDGDAEPAVPHWFSIISPAGTREQIIRQARLDDYLVTAPDAMPELLRTGRWRSLADAVRRWAELDPARRVVVIELLTQLGFHPAVARLVPQVTMTPEDELGQQLAYEVARSCRQLDRHSTVPLQVFGWLAEEAVRPSLRVSAALQVASALTRAQRAPEQASDWLKRCAAASTELRHEPAWLEHLVRSRVHRAAALVAVRLGKPANGADEMRAALAEDDLLADVDADPQASYQLENRALVLEAFLKLDTATSLGAAPADVVTQARQVDPYDVDLHFAVGRYLVAQDAADQGVQAFLTAAGSGTVRGAVAAFEAGLALDRLGRPGEAAAAYRLCLDLDPASTSARERLTAGPVAAGRTS